AAEALTYPDEGKSFTGKVTAVIGNALDPLTDIKRVILAANIPQDFSKETLEEAKHYKEVPDEKDFKGRKDLRSLDLITIDGATAKDFDDAVYVEINNQGFQLYVAIADVSHYVQVGSAIDRDAYERGTSVYFPNFVVPMLPEVLSNGLCSLNPHVPRLCMVAEMQFDFTGEMTHSDFYEAVMESKSRVTYGEAQEIIDGNVVEKHAHVKENILRLSDLAKILMAKRFKDGSLDLEIPETELVIDGAGVPIDIQKSERLFSHRLIEEMMLAANVAVAKFLDGRKVPALYRIHEPPNEQSIHLLERYMATFGGKVKLSHQGKLQKRLTKALEEFENRPEAQILNILTLRSMNQAKYSPNNVGHFGLGFDFYAHFTSPIRRYPDLIIHRLLKNQVVKSSQYRLMSEDDLATAGTI
ncbi:MAG TPA: VacB/RNase II family 3'-5' exoribonuclease, partial [Bdellovibrio sp.]|nr:VacB/RNase II family 3'-5' exoribonuclease [Bdellovibrio sp.]